MSSFSKFMQRPIILNMHHGINFRHRTYETAHWFLMILLIRRCRVKTYSPFTNCQIKILSKVPITTIVTRQILYFLVYTPDFHRQINTKSIHLQWKAFSLSRRMVWNSIHIHTCHTPTHVSINYKTHTYVVYSVHCVNTLSRDNHLYYSYLPYCIRFLILVFGDKIQFLTPLLSTLSLSTPSSTCRGTFSTCTNKERSSDATIDSNNTVL